MPASTTRWGGGGGSAATRCSSIAVSSWMVIVVPPGIDPPVSALPTNSPRGSSTHPNNESKKPHAPHSASTNAASRHSMCPTVVDTTTSARPASTMAAPRIPRTTPRTLGGSVTSTGSKLTAPARRRNLRTRISPGVCCDRSPVAPRVPYRRRRRGHAGGRHPVPDAPTSAPPTSEPLGGEARRGLERERIAGRAKGVRHAAPGGGHARRGDRGGEDPGARPERRLGGLRRPAQRRRRGAARRLVHARTYQTRRRRGCARGDQDALRGREAGAQVHEPHFPGG